MVNPHSCQVNPSHVQCQLKAQVTSSTNKALTALWGKFPIQLPCFRLKTSSITRRLFCCACAMHLHWLHTHGAHGTFLVTTSHCWSFLMADVETEKSPLLVAGVVFWGLPENEKTRNLSKKGLHHSSTCKNFPLSPQKVIFELAVSSPSATTRESTWCASAVSMLVMA